MSIDIMDGERCSSLMHRVLPMLLNLYQDDRAEFLSGIVREFYKYSYRDTGFFQQGGPDYDLKQKMYTWENVESLEESLQECIPSYFSDNPTIKMICTSIKSFLETQPPKQHENEIKQWRYYMLKKKNSELHKENSDRQKNWALETYKLKEEISRLSRLTEEALVKENEILRQEIVKLKQEAETKTRLLAEEKTRWFPRLNRRTEHMEILLTNYHAAHRYDGDPAKRLMRLRARAAMPGLLSRLAALTDT